MKNSRADLPCSREYDDDPFIPPNGTWGSAPAVSLFTCTTPASIFTRDLGRALAFAREIEAGVVHVNSETAGAEPQVPFGGMKGSSSYSREQGKSAREFFTQVKTVYIDPPPATA